MIKRKYTIIISIFILILLLCLSVVAIGIHRHKITENQLRDLRILKSNMNEYEKKLDWDMFLAVREYNAGKLSKEEMNKSKIDCIIQLTKKMEEGSLKNVLEKIDGLEIEKFMENHSMIFAKIPVYSLIEVAKIPEVQVIYRALDASTKTNY